MTGAEKWRFLFDAPLGDSKHPALIELAGHLLAAARGSPRHFATLAHSVARDWVIMRSDTERTGDEDIAGLTRDPMPDDAIDALTRGEDDCDAKARLFVALCLAAGLQARMCPRWTSSGELSHVFAEVRLGGVWLPVELTLARAVIGERGHNVPLEPDGKWLLGGHRPKEWKK